FVERSVFLAEGVDVFVVAKALRYAKRGTGHRRAALRVVFIERLSCRGRERDTKGRVLNGDVDVAGGNGRAAVYDRDRRVRIAEVAIDDCIRVIAHLCMTRGDAHTDDLRR